MINPKDVEKFNTEKVRKGLDPNFVDAHTDCRGSDKEGDEEDG